MPRCALLEMHATGQCFHPQPYLIGGQMAAAGLYVLEKCEKARAIFDYRQAIVHAYGDTPVAVGTWLLTREPCVERNTYYKTRYVLGKHLNFAHPDVAEQHRTRKRVEGSHASTNAFDTYTSCYSIY